MSAALTKQQRRRNSCDPQDGAQAHQPQGFTKIVSQSPLMQELFRRVKQAAQADSTVLITGESGTGKELIAQAIHANSPRASGPFVVVNMAAVPESLIESELFGHVKGAFTGAGASRQGRFEAAHHGALFIDEIGDLKRSCQAKLLRVLENHKVTPVGSNCEREADVRVIAATNRPLEMMMDESDFREDLYYRLNVVRIALPPLRQRREDIPLLVEHFLAEFCQAYDRPLPTRDAKLDDFLKSYSWPGNVRQLRNCVESMIVLADSDRLTMDDLPSMMLGDAPRSPRGLVVPEGLTLAEIERAVIRKTLDRCCGDRTLAATKLGISVRTLQRKMAKLST